MFQYAMFSGSVIKILILGITHQFLYTIFSHKYLKFTEGNLEFICIFWDVPWLWRYGTSVFELQEMFPVVVQGLGQFLPLFDAILFQQLGGELLTRRLSGVNGFVVRFTRHCQKESKELLKSEAISSKYQSSEFCVTTLEDSPNHW